MKSLGTARFFVTFLILTTEAWRVCTNAGARNRGIEVVEGRAICATLSLAIEAKHRSIAVMVAVIDEAPGNFLARDYNYITREKVRTGSDTSLPGKLGAKNSGDLSIRRDMDLESQAGEMLAGRPGPSNPSIAHWLPTPPQ